MCPRKYIGERPNGCGCASGWLKWLRPPYAVYFRDCCIIHDSLYNEGGSEEQRKASDIRLFTDMVSLSLENTPFKAWRLTWIALIYYWSVRLFGKKYFNYVNA